MFTRQSTCNSSKHPEQLLRYQTLGFNAVGNVTSGSMSSINIAFMQVTELAILACLPNVLLQWRVVKPMRYMVAGTMLVRQCPHKLCLLRWVLFKPIMTALHVYLSAYCYLIWPYCYLRLLYELPKQLQVGT